MGRLCKKMKTVYNRGSLFQSNFTTNHPIMGNDEKKLVNFRCEACGWTRRVRMPADADPESRYPDMMKLHNDDRPGCPYGDGIKAEQKMSAKVGNVTPA